MPVSQQLVDVVHRIRDRGVRADQRAFHAAGAEVGDEVRNLAAEQALVLPRAALPAGMNMPVPGSTGASAIVPSRNGAATISS